MTRHLKSEKRTQEHMRLSSKERADIDAVKEVIGADSRLNTIRKVFAMLADLIGHKEDSNHGN